MSNSIPTVFERELSTDMIDPNLDFRMPNESDVVMNRRTVKISPQSGGGDAIKGGSNSAIRFKLNSGDFVDVENLYMTVDYQQNLTNDDATNRAEPPNGVACLIREIRLRSGTGTEIETIREVGLLQSILQDYSFSKTHNETVHTISGGGQGYKQVADLAGGADDTNDRMGAVANTAEKFSFHLPSGFLHSCGKYLDVVALKGLIIELELYNDATALKGVGAGAGGGATPATYTLGNPQIIYDEIQVSPAYKKMYLTQMANKGFLNVPYSTYTHTQNNKSDSIRISRSVSRLKDIISVARTDANKNSLGHLSLEEYDALGANGEWSYQIGSHHYPVGNCKGLSQTYRETLKVFGRHKDCYCGAVNFSQFKANKGIVCVDTELSLGTAFSGTKTTDNPDIMLVSSNLFSANAGTVDTWLHHERILKYGNGMAEVLE